MTTRQLVYSQTDSSDHTDCKLELAGFGASVVLLLAGWQRDTSCTDKQTARATLTITLYLQGPVPQSSLATYRPKHLQALGAVLGNPLPSPHPGLSDSSSPGSSHEEPLQHPRGPPDGSTRAGAGRMLRLWRQGCLALALVNTAYQMQQMFWILCLPFLSLDLREIPLQSRRGALHQTCCTRPFSFPVHMMGRVALGLTHC